MTTFRTMSRALVITAVVCASSAMAFDAAAIVNLIGKIVKDNNVKPVATTAVGIAGGLMLKEQLEKESPVAIAFVAGLSGGACSGTKAGVVAAAASLAISGVRTVAPEVEALDKVTDKLPKCLKSKEAKMVTQIVVATAVGRMVGGADKGKKGNGQD